MSKKLPKLYQVHILTEGGQKNGFGHIMRCLSLQQAFAQQSFAAQLIINGKQTECKWVASNNLLFTNWLEKPKKAFSLARDSKILIIDSYLASSALYQKIKDQTNCLVCIDDTNRVSYPNGSIVINGSSYGENVNYKKTTENLVGLEYSLIRKSFWKIPPKKIKRKLESIMITFGGGDFRKMTAPILQLVSNIYPHLIKKVIISQAFKNIDKIKKNGDKLTQFIDSPLAGEMLDIMLEADLAISSGGQTLYELARVGVPTIVITEANNQKRNVLGWKKLKFVKDAGVWNNSNINHNIKTLLISLEKEKVRKDLSQLGRSIIDGQGSIRVVNKLIQKIRLSRS